MQKTHVLYVKIPCPGCIDICKQAFLELKKELNGQFVRIETRISLEPLQGIIQVTVNEQDKRTDQDLILQLKVFLEERACEVSFAHTTVSAREHVLKGAGGLLLGSVMLVLTLAGVVIPFALMTTLFVISSLLTLYLGKETYIAAMHEIIKRRSPGMHTLFAVSTLVAMGASIAAFFVPWLPMMCNAGLLIFGFKHIGDAIKLVAQRKLTVGLGSRSLVADRYQTIDGRYVLLEQLKPGDDIVISQTVREGIVPVDGICYDEESAIIGVSGETRPTVVKQGDRLVAGMHLAENIKNLRVRVTATYADSALAAGDAMIKAIMANRTLPETTANKLLRYFVPIVFGVALVLSIGVGVFFTPALAIQCFVTLLVSACPCTLGLVDPLARDIAKIKLSTHGAVMLDDEVGYEKVVGINAVVFDKNGTLTTGEDEVVAADDFSDDEWRQIYAFEKDKKHHTAKAICRYIENEKKITALNGVLDKPDMAFTNESHNEEDEYKVGFFGKTITLSVAIRPEAKQVIDTLRARNIEVYVLSGGNCAGIAKKFGLAEANVIGGCQEKAKQIKAWQQPGYKIAFVGDAGNDREAMAQSDCGFFLAKSIAADKTNLDVASVMIKQASLAPILATLTIAKQTVNNIRQSYAISLIYNIVAMFVPVVWISTVGTALNPAIGVVLMIAQMLLVLGNAFRFRHQAVPVFVKQPSSVSPTVIAEPGVAPVSQLSLGQSFEPGRVSQMGMMAESSRDQSFNASRMNNGNTSSSAYRRKMS